MTGRGLRLVVAALSLEAALLTPATALAQDEEGFTKSATEHFSFVYREQYRPVIGETLETAEASRREVLAALESDVEGPVAEVRFARNIEEMRSLSPRRPPSWADAVAFWPDNVIVISLTTSQHRPVTLSTVFRHELSHLALRWVIGDAKVPRWFNEGLAVTVSGELPMERIKLLWPGAARGEITPLRQLESRFPAREFEANRAYAESADFVRFLTRHRGSWRIGELLQRLSDGEPFYQAMAETWNRPVSQLEQAWHRDLRRRYSVIPAVTAGMTMWVVVALLAIWAYVKRRRDIRKRIDAMADEIEEEREAASLEA